MATKKKKLENNERRVYVDAWDEWIINNGADLLKWVKLHNPKKYADIQRTMNELKKPALSSKQRRQAIENFEKSLVNRDGVPLVQLMKDAVDPIYKKMDEVAAQYYDNDITKVKLTDDSKNTLKLWAPVRSMLLNLPTKKIDFDNLNIDEAFSDNYNYEQMIKLAKKYGFNYDSIDDRKEFLELLRQYHQQKELDKIWDEPTPGNILTGIAFPVSKEYGKQNYEKIGTKEMSDANMIKPLLVDLAALGTMAYGGRVPTAVGSFLGSNVAAPVMTEVGQMALNNKSFKDAATDAGLGVVLNFAGAKMVEGASNYLASPIKKFFGDYYHKKVRPFTARINDMVNTSANKARYIGKGGIYRERLYSDAQLKEIYKARKDKILDQTEWEEYKFPEIENNESFDSWRNKVIESRANNYKCYKSSNDGPKEVKLSLDEAEATPIIDTRENDYIAGLRMARGNPTGTNIISRIFGKNKNQYTTGKDIREYLQNFIKASEKPNASYYEKKAANNYRAEIRNNNTTPERLEEIAREINENYMRDILDADGTLDNSYKAPLVNAGYKESFDNFIGRSLDDVRESTQAVNSLMTNLLSSNRATDEYLNQFVKLNGVYQYGNSNNNTDDVDAENAMEDPRTALYAQAYAKFIQHPKYYPEPPEPDFMPSKKITALQNAIKATFGTKK